MQAGHDSAAFVGDGQPPAVASATTSLPTLAPATVGLDPMADVHMHGGAGQSPINDRFATAGNAVANGASHTASADGEHGKAKQKRNKPTLSCLECVERKTKCDRARPCLACVKRQSSCEYTAVANLIASASSTKTGSGSGKARYVTKPSAKARKASNASSLISPSTTNTTDNGWSSIDSRSHMTPRGSTARAS